MRVLIIRHGDPYYPTDSLTEKGKREAELLSLKLADEGITEIFVSPHGRAQLTAKPTVEKTGLVPTTLEWLREFPYKLKDSYSTDFYTDIFSPWNIPPLLWTQDRRNYHPDEWRNSDIIKGSDIPDGFDYVGGQLDAFLAERGFVKDKEKNGGFYHITEKGENNGDTVALFCHCGVGSAMIAYILGLSPIAVWNSLFLAPSSVTTLFMERHLASLPIAHAIFTGIGDTSHLYAGKEPISCSGLHSKMLK